MNPRVFREYDIRGEAERDFPNDFVADLGDFLEDASEVGGVVRQNRAVKFLRAETRLPPAEK